jgi:hypothetical protein
VKRVKLKIITYNSRKYSGVILIGNLKLKP